MEDAMAGWEPKSQHEARRPIFWGVKLPMVILGLRVRLDSFLPSGFLSWGGIAPNTGKNIF